jgi:hypothetical protein
MKPRLPTLSGDRGAWKSRSCAGRDMLGMKISAPPKGDDGIGIPKLVYHMQGLVSLNRLAPVLLKSRHNPHAGSGAKTQQSVAEVKPYRQLLFATP